MNEQIIEFEQKLYPAAIEVFSNKEFHKITFNELSKLSGVNLSLIRSNFSSKEELLFAIIDKKISEIMSLIQTYTQGVESAKEIFRKCFFVIMEYCDRNPGVTITFFITVPPVIWMKHKNYNRKEVYEILNEIIQQARKRNEIDPSIKNSYIMRLFTMHCFNAVHMWYFKNKQWKLVDAIPKFFPIFWKTVSYPAPQASVNYSFSR